MRRTVWTLAPLLLCLGACVPDVDVVHDETLSGHLTVKTFRVRPGVVVLADKDLVVDSRGPALVEGDIRGEIGSGAAIEIRVSTGDCVVDGRLEAGSGADGDEPGEDGAAGGAVRLRAGRGLLRVRGALAAGDGGAGAGRLEQGRGELRVASGAGGAGGDVELIGASVELSSGAAAGDGGAGGAAFAQVFELAPGAPSVVDSGESLADEEEDGIDEEPVPPAGGAHALSRAGGAGGSIRIETADLREGPSPAEVRLRAGAGGATSRASARGGAAASAELAKPGAGGDVSVRAGSAPLPAGWLLLPGAGGDAGLLGAISGAALARTAAGAAIAGGGSPGKVILEGAAIGSGAGGDSGNVLAQTDQDAKYDFGDAGSAGTPGKPAAARAP